MPKYPTVGSREAVKALQRLGFEVISQKGSHIKMARWIGATKVITIVPDHREIDRYTLKGVLQLADVSEEDFFANI